VSLCIFSFPLESGLGFRNALCLEPYMKEQMIDAKVFPSPASCFLSCWRFKLSFGKFGVDIVGVQLFVNESGHPMHRVDEYTV
jgi:hypothetical protein